MIKIIFCDMDGTLLDEQGKLPAEFPAVAAELRKRGVMFAPASGRQYFSLLDTFKGYEDEFMFLAENGTLVRYREEELFSDTLDKSLAEAVLAYDDVVDRYFDRMKAAIIALVAKNPADGEFALDLLMISKYFERIGDHATNIAEWVIYSVTGIHKGE